MIYLLKKDLKELLIHRKRILLILLVLIILIIGTSYNGKKIVVKQPGVKIQFGVIDNDKSSYSKLLLDYFRKSESFSSYINIVENTSREIETLFNNGELDIYLEIPKDFAKNMIYMEHLPIKVNINSTDTTKSILLKNVLESYEKYIHAVEVNCIALYDLMNQKNMDQDLITAKNLEISYDLIFTALGKEEFFEFNEVSEFSSTSLLSYYIYVILFFILFYSSFYIGLVIMKERKQGTIRRLMSTGLNINKFILEKTIFGVSILYLCISFLSLVLSYIRRTNINFNMYLFSFVSVLFCVSFAILISGCFRNIQIYLFIGNILGFFICILGGSIIPIMYLPNQLVFLSKLTPNYWFIKVMTTLETNSNIEFYYKLVFIMLICSILFYLISTITFKNREVSAYD